MQAVLLAAGESSRFYPYNNIGHKSLITLGGKTLIRRTLDALKRLKITDVIIVENSSENISKTLSKEDTNGLSVRFIIQEKPTGMGDALLLASRYVQKSYLLLNAYHFDFEVFYKDMISAKQKEDDVVLLTREDENASDFGAIVKKRGKTVVSEKTEKKSKDRIIGIYLLNKEFLSVLSAEKKTHYNFEKALTTYSQKETLVLVQAKKETISIKYPWDLLRVKDYLLLNLKTKISKSTKISPKATIHGKVEIAEDVTIMDGVVISGPAYIGKGAYIGTNSIIRAGVYIEQNAVIGAHMEVKNSIVMKGATTHSGFIGDSVIGEQTKMAAGFYTANVRLDRKEIASTVRGEKVNTHYKYLGVILGSNSSLGIKVGTMPGIVVGNNVVVGPGTTIMENIEDDTTYYTKFEAIVKKKS